MQHQFYDIAVRYHLALVDEFFAFWCLEKLGDGNGWVGDASGSENGRCMGALARSAVRIVLFLVHEHTCRVDFSHTRVHPSEK